MNKFFTLILLLLQLSGASGQTLAPPQVMIRVGQYETEFDFVLSKAGTWQNALKSGTLKAGQTYSVIGEITEPARRRFHLMTGSAPLHDTALQAEVEARFSQFDVYRVLVGNQPEAGYPDNRMIFFGVGLYDDEEAAKTAQDQLSAQNISSWIFPENLAAAQGTLKILQGNSVLVESNDNIFLRTSGTTLVKQIEFAKGFSWHGREDRRFAGDLKVQLGVENLIDVIEITDLESLLVGIVPSEISASAPEAALQAQAVAARGEMLAKRGVRHIYEGYDYCAEQHCQVYKGMQSINIKMRQAITPTQGLIMLKKDGTILDAVYGGNCGGHTASNHRIWTSNPDPHLQGVPDHKGKAAVDLTDEIQARQFIKNPPECWCSMPGVEGSNKFRWSRNFNGVEWKKIETELGLGRIKNIDSFDREISGRIVSLKISGSDGELVIMKELPIRRAFGMLKSSFFTLSFHRDKEGYITAARFEGAGWGHGVGMCQTGAQSRAKHGQSYTQILSHYFPEIKFHRLY